MALPEFNESIQKLISMYRNDNNYYDDDYDNNEQLIK